MPQPQTPASVAARTLGYREQHFHSFVEQERALPGWRRSYHQITPGSYSGVLAGLALEGMELHRESVGLGTWASFRIPDDRVCLCLSLNISDRRTGSMGDFGHGEGLLHLPGIDYHLLLEAGSDYLLAMFPPDRVPTALVERLHRIPPPLSRGMTNWLSTVMESARRDVAPEGLRGIIPDLLLDQISYWAEAGVAARSARMPASRRVPPRNDARLVADAMALTSRLSPHELSVGRVAYLLGTDRSMLRRAFLTQTGFPLDSLLAGRRLSAVYRQLLLARPGSVRISRLSLDLGFTHWGRFASAYRGMFGERPSDTLRRICLACT